MKLQQLRYILEVYRQNLNISAAAESLFTSQPGISKQIRLLEEEIGVQIFLRQGKRISAVTEPGRLILDIAERILREAQNIKKAGDEFAQKNNGLFSLSTSHTLAKYALPSVIEAFSTRYPEVDLSIHTDRADQMTEALLAGEIDLAVLEHKTDHHPDLCYLPCSQSSYVIIAPLNYEINQEDITLERLAQETLITSDNVRTPHSPITQAFQAASLPLPRILLSSADDELIKTYVVMGLGLGIVSQNAIHEASYQKLKVYSAQHLFAPSPISIILRRDRYLRGFMYDFIELFAPELTQAKISRLLYRPLEEDFSI